MLWIYFDIIIRTSDFSDDPIEIDLSMRFPLGQSVVAPDDSDISQLTNHQDVGTKARRPTPTFRKED